MSARLAELCGKRPKVEAAATNASSPAFPCEIDFSDGKITGHRTANHSGIEMGLTKREWFAGMALPGLLSRPEDYTRNEAARYAMEAADVLIEQLNAK